MVANKEKFLALTQWTLWLNCSMEAWMAVKPWVTVATTNHAVLSVNQRCYRLRASILAEIQEYIPAQIQETIVSLPASIQGISPVLLSDITYRPSSLVVRVSARCVLGVWSASHNIRYKNWEVCASQLGINELHVGNKLAKSESL